MHHGIGNLYGALVGLLLGATTAGLAFILSIAVQRIVFLTVLVGGALGGCVIGFSLSPEPATHALLGFAAAVIVCAFLLLVLVITSGGSRDTNWTDLASKAIFVYLFGGPLAAASGVAGAVTAVWHDSPSALTVLCVCEVLVLSLGAVGTRLFKTHFEADIPPQPPGQDPDGSPIGPPSA